MLQKIKNGLKWVADHTGISWVWKKISSGWNWLFGGKSATNEAGGAANQPGAKTKDDGKGNEPEVKPEMKKALKTEGNKATDNPSNVPLAPIGGESAEGGQECWFEAPENLEGQDEASLSGSEEEEEHTEGVPGDPFKDGSRAASPASAPGESPEDKKPVNDEAPLTGLNEQSTVGTGSGQSRK